MDCKETLIENLSLKDIRVRDYITLVFNDADFRQYIINELLNNSYIMVYYNCHLILVEATEGKPHIFYEYWNSFVSLLDHKNSYHRNYALIIISNLLLADSENRFDKIFDRYFSLLHDEKFLTRRYCLQCSAKIINCKPVYANQIFNLLLDFVDNYKGTEKQRNLLIKDLRYIYCLLSPDHDIDENIETRVERLSANLKLRKNSFVNSLTL